MKCQVCGNENPAESLFCRVCQEVFILPEHKPAAPATASEPFPLAPQSLPWSDRRFLFALFVLFALLAAARPWLENLWLLDMVNLAFHEAGHPIFGLLGIRFLMVLGGTLMQLLMPLAALAHFGRRKQRVSACAAFVWFGQNFIGIGRYMADARAQQLELVGSGEHDWTYLLETTGLLLHDVGLGSAAQLLGCLIMAAGLVGIWRFAFNRD